MGRSSFTPLWTTTTRTGSPAKLNNKATPVSQYTICLFTLPGIPSVYYGGEWGIEGKRTNTSDEALRPAISIEQEGELHCELTA